MRTWKGKLRRVTEERAPAWEPASRWQASPDKTPHESVTGYFYTVTYARVAHAKMIFIEKVKTFEHF